MKHDLARKPGEKKDTMLAGSQPVMPEKEPGPSYPMASVYELPEGVKDLKVGDLITIEARVRGLHMTEKGIQNLDLDLMHMEDGKKDVSMKKEKKEKDEDFISKGVDEEADKKEDEDE